MPKELEQDLRATAARKGYTGRRADRYVYGTMNRMGVMHGNKVTEKGKKMAAREGRKGAVKKRMRKMGY